MATLARHVITRYPNYYRYFSTRQFTYRGKTYTNHNRLMSSYPGMDGFKTGFINASGFNLIASAKRDGRRLIGIVFGGRSWKTRNDHMASLLNTGFAKAGQVRFAKAEQLAPVAESPKMAAAAPVPPVKPVFKTIQSQGAGTAIAAADMEPRQAAAAPSFTSLSSLQPTVKAIAPTPAGTLQLPADYMARQAPPDVTEQAIADVRSAVNRGDYSELTGEGDYDAGTARRVEAGLLSAAVYKGEHEKFRQMQQARLPAGAALPSPPPPPASTNSGQWAIQIGAYNSRVATDDALRRTHLQLPSTLIHATPVVVPLQTGEGMLFRGRFGNLTREQAIAACSHFRDCLPVAPR
jgi:D-alanyl-D-alanine carboxypeptidase